MTSGTLGPRGRPRRGRLPRPGARPSPTLFNEVRVGDTRRHVDCSAASLTSSATAALGLPGIPSTARFPNTLPTFLIAGYQQLGSPPNTATDFGTSVTEVADTLTWVRGRHTVKAASTGAGRA